MGKMGKMGKMLVIEVPNELRFNSGVSTKNYLVSDTNDSSNWKILKYKLPTPIGKWEIWNKEKKI